MRSGLGRSHGRQKAKQLSRGGSGIDTAKTKLELMRGAEAGSSFGVVAVVTLYLFFCGKLVIVFSVILQKNILCFFVKPHFSLSVHDTLLGSTQMCALGSLFLFSFA